MVFEYDSQKVFTGSIDVVDPGNMCLHCMNAIGDEFYILTKTTFGKIGILKIGPVSEGQDKLISGFSVDYKRIDYNPGAILKDVQMFINDRKKINFVEEVLISEAVSKIPNYIELFMNNGDDD